MWQAVSNGWMPPETITEEYYKHIRSNKDEDKAIGSLYRVCNEFWWEVVWWVCEGILLVLQTT